MKKSISAPYGSRIDLPSDEIPPAAPFGFDRLRMTRRVMASFYRSRPPRGKIFHLSAGQISLAEGTISLYVRLGHYPV